MTKKLITIAAIAALMVGCGKVELPDPVIHNFSANPITLPSEDTIDFTIDAEGDYITLYDGKATLDISDEEMPFEYQTQKLKLSFKVTPPADTVYAKLVVTNVYDAEQIKSVRDSIKFILLPEE